MLILLLSTFLLVNAILLVIILITIYSTNRIFLFITLTLNIISLYLMIFHIQLIGWNILSSCIFLIIVNNLFAFLKIILTNIVKTTRVNKFKHAKILYIKKPRF
jgi:hypothetical protein